MEPLPFSIFSAVGFLFGTVLKEIMPTFQALPLRDLWNSTITPFHAANCIDTYNEVFEGVSIAILSRTVLDHRVGKVVDFINLSFELCQMQDFEGASCLCESLKSFPIQRLKDTWRKIPKEIRDKWYWVLDTLRSSDFFRSSALLKSPPLVPNLKQIIETLSYHCVPSNGPGFNFSYYVEPSRDFQRLSTLRSQLPQSHPRTYELPAPHEPILASSMPELQIILNQCLLSTTNTTKECSTCGSTTHQDHTRKTEWELYQASLLCEPKEPTRKDLSITKTCFLINHHGQGQDPH
ncbi:hypothetical protein Pelo_4805 [Pelomyxa schiedti]|nr:hypothetical protein Pelo_4805 [Pelomyxa schiedti]